MNLFAIFQSQSQLFRSVALTEKENMFNMHVCIAWHIWEFCQITIGNAKNKTKFFAFIIPSIIQWQCVVPIVVEGFNWSNVWIFYVDVKHLFKVW